MTANYIVHDTKFYKAKDQPKTKQKAKNKRPTSLLVLSHVYNISHLGLPVCAQTVRVPVFSVLLRPLLAYTESLTNVEENSATTFLFPL